MQDVCDFNCREASRRFIEIRTQAGMTQEQLADRLGVSLQTIKNYEKAGSGNVRDTATDTRANAIAGMKIETLFKMAKLFNVSADYLMCISNITSSDYGIQKVHEFTGLSQAAIESIISIQRHKFYSYEMMDILNWLFSCGWISSDEILERLFAVALDAQHIQNLKRMGEMEYKETEDELELSCYKAIKSFIELVDQFVEHTGSPTVIEKWEKYGYSGEKE